MAKPLQYNAHLVERIDITAKLAIFRVKPDQSLTDTNNSWFQAGQYTTLGLNNEQQPSHGSVRRPMSIASPPHQIDSVDFYIRYVEQPTSDNPLTHLLWQLAGGERCFLRPGAVGKFTFQDTIGTDDPRQLVLVAAGTGIAPFISMIGAAIDTDCSSLDHIALLHGVSYPTDFAYRTYLQKLVDTHGLRYHSTVSRPEASPDWHGCQGRVEDFFLPERLAATEHRLGLEVGGLNTENCVIYICGLQGTIKASVERLLQRGFVPDQRKLRKALGFGDDLKPNLFWEQYDNEPIINTKNPAEIEHLQQLLNSS